MTLVRLDHDALERLEVGVSAEEPHPADRAFQNMIDLPAWCFASCSGHGLEGSPARRPTPTSRVPVSRPSRVPHFILWAP